MPAYDRLVGVEDRRYDIFVPVEFSSLNGHDLVLSLQSERTLDASGCGRETSPDSFFLSLGF